MKAKDVSVGTRVTDQKYHYKKGIISSNEVSDPDSDDETVIVDWDDEGGWRGGRNHKTNINDLRIVPSLLEKDWLEMDHLLKEAATAIKKAADAAKAKGSSLYEWDAEGTLSFQEVFEQVDLAGWNTSSMTRDC